jgi:ankyrin repeat protein
VQTLLRFGANPHQLRPSVHGKSPLSHLVIAGPSPQRSDTGFLDVIRILLRAGVDINGLDHEGWTPLHVAASWNLYAVIKELASFGGHALDWEAETDDGQSAIDLCRNGGGNEEVVNILLNHTLDNIDDISNGCALSYNDDDGDGVLIEKFHDALEGLGEDTCV